MNRLAVLIKRILRKKKWRKINTHNETQLISSIPLEKVVVGNYTYGNINAIWFEEPNARLEIGSFCSIANGTKFILGGEHNYKNLSTFPMKNKFIDNSIIESFSKGPVIVEDDVWIGTDSLILSGVTIGRGTIIGAGSVVRESIPPFSIYVGNRIVKKRFSDEICNELTKINWINIDKNDVCNNIEDIYSFEKLKKIPQDFFVR